MTKIALVFHSYSTILKIYYIINLYISLTYYIRISSEFKKMFSVISQLTYTSVRPDIPHLKFSFPTYHSHLTHTTLTNLHRLGHCLANEGFQRKDAPVILLGFFLRKPQEPSNKNSGRINTLSHVLVVNLIHPFFLLLI